MPRPGVSIISRTSPPTFGPDSVTGTWFVAGTSDRGPSTVAREVRSLSDLETIYGPRASYSVLWDSLETFFREGGKRAFVSRVVGPAPTKATVALPGAASALSISVDSVGEGAFPGTAQVVAGSAAGTFVLVIALNGSEVERSPDLADVAAAVAWSTGSDYVRVRATGTVDPIVQGPTAIAGGDDARASITDTERIASLTRFTKGMGPGQVSFPGATTVAVQVAVAAHAAANNRVPLLDGPDTADDATLKTAADTFRSSATLEEETRSALFAPWLLIPGVVRSTFRTVPPSAVAAGLIARSDGATGNVNNPAAGSQGEARFAVGLSQPEWSDAAREAMNAKGVDVFRMVYGAVRLYGFRTLVDAAGEATAQAGWLSLAASRTRMAITHDADVLGEEFMFDQIDGRGVKLSEWQGALIGMLAGYWQRGALFGETSGEAFAVDVGSSVNTPTTIGNGELRAVLALKVSPFAEAIQVEIVKIPVTQSI